MGHAVTVVDGKSRMDFFVSHAGRDRAWAEWVAWQLAEAGFSVELDMWDWSAGDDFVLRINDALERCNRMVALWSAAYFERLRFTTLEWTALVALHGRMVPVRVEEVIPPPILASTMYADLFGLGEQQAVRALLVAVGRKQSGPAGRPEYPRSGGAGAAEVTPRFPGSLPSVWNVPPRSRAFTGRDALLVRLRESLQAGHRTAVHALHGLGGVGKTALAVEYAYLFAGDYRMVWWVNAERADLIGEQLAGLAVAAGVVESGTTTPAAVPKVLGYLAGRSEWLVIFDNAASATQVAGWIPQGPGHVIITSRSPVWTPVAAPLAVDTFTRAESVALLTSQVEALSGEDAERVARQLGDLPLGVAQAGGVMTATGMSATELLDALRTQAGVILASDQPPDYPHPVAAMIQIAVAEAGQQNPAAAALAQLCATLAPEPIPVWLLNPIATGPPATALDSVTGAAVALRRLLGHLVGYGLVQANPDTVTMHRLTQAIIRDGLAEQQRQVWRARAEAFLIAADPGNPVGPDTWPRWGYLLPHILATDPESTTNRDMMFVVCEAVWYLHVRGDYATALRIGTSVYERWRERLGADDHYVLYAANNVARAYVGLGQYELARQLDEDILARMRRTLGEDHPDTLISASNLADDLRYAGEPERARQLDEDTLARRRLVLGEDHPDTLASASNLAGDLDQAGEHKRARQLDEDTLGRRRLVLGEDHPHTLGSASNLAIDLREAGEYERARELDEDTLARRRRVLGEDHPHTLTSASNLASDLRAAGEYEQARELDEDTLVRRRRVLGEDHPDTLTSASTLAGELRRAGEYEQARELDEDTLVRRRRVLGEDHPDTLTSASNLASDLRAAGEYEQARELDDDTLVRRRRVLGEDHPDTLTSASTLAGELRRAGEYEQARELDEDTLVRRRRVLGEDH